MITVEANELAGFIHNEGKNSNRMPLMIQPEDESKLLDLDLSKEEIKALMKTFPSNLMDAYKVKKDFRNKKSYDPTIIEPENP